MRKLVLPFFCVLGLVVCGPALADGPSGSTECHLQDDDCDGVIDEDTGGTADDNDGDGRVDVEAPVPEDLVRLWRQRTESPWPALPAWRASPPAP